MEFNFKIELPIWAIEYGKTLSKKTFLGDKEKMQIAIDLSLLNTQNNTGGPFGAAIFNSIDNSFVSLGINLVTKENCSILHAEIVSILLAQRHLKTYDLSSKGDFSLFTSTEPCAMCLGAIPWAGLSRVVFGATGSDAEAIGFDEGAKPCKGIYSLSNIGVEVVSEVLRDQAKNVLLDYSLKGGNIYNGLQDKK